MIRPLLIALCWVIASQTQARCETCARRDQAAVREFKRAHPCPATGRSSGRCPGWIVDHVIALCDGGSDTPSNMQWQTAAEAKAKDRTECGRGR